VGFFQISVDAEQVIFGGIQQEQAGGTGGCDGLGQSRSDIAARARD
jgi:hypothetical protein